MSDDIICHVLICQIVFYGSYMHCVICWLINIFYFQATELKISRCISKAYMPAQWHHCFATTAWPMGCWNIRDAKAHTTALCCLVELPTRFRNAALDFHYGEITVVMSPIMSRDRVCKKGSRVPTDQQCSFRSPFRYRKHLEVYCAAFAQFCSPQYSQSRFCQSHGTFELIFNTTVKVTILKVTV